MIVSCIALWYLKNDFEDRPAAFQCVHGGRKIKKTSSRIAAGKKKPESLATTVNLKILAAKTFSFSRIIDILVNTILAI